MTVASERPFTADTFTAMDKLAFARELKTAGVVSGTRYHGKNTPLKGKGAPPPDLNYRPFRSTKHFVPGRSFVVSDYLVGSQANTLPRKETPTSPKCSKRMLASSFLTHLKGGGLIIPAENKIERPRSAKHRGLNNPVIYGPTHDRVIGHCLDKDGYQDACARKHDEVWNNLYMEHLQRPSTAPESRMFDRTFASYPAAEATVQREVDTQSIHDDSSSVASKACSSASKSRNVAGKARYVTGKSDKPFSTSAASGKSNAASEHRSRAASKSSRTACSAFNAEQFDTRSCQSWTYRSPSMAFHTFRNEYQTNATRGRQSTVFAN